ncbi:uncharacterized protein LOC143521483 isoform X1 [Brachyhypopomus gauderio]|uniref:uncharacterized protein LOC143521483 isoform X1 n=1 Tax=Brachyhypopomus gauderio TaxID=698409 RepID=UPI0040421F97
MFVGLFGVHDYGEMQNVYMSYDEALERVFSQFDACLFTVKLNTCAIVKQGSCYVLIDSHARNSHGQQIKSGTSLVAYHVTMESLLNHVKVLGLSLNADKMPFEITGVTATVRIVMPETFEGDRLSVMDSTEIETTMYTDDSACSSVKASSHLLYSDAIKHKRVTDGENVSADQRAKRVRTSGNELCEDVVLVTETQADNFKFSPLTTQQQKTMCLKLNIVYIDHNRAELHTPAIMGAPCKTQTITGDGNCFFRSLAFAISGSEKEHRKIRCATVKHIEKNEARYVNYLREGYSCVSQYISKTRMKYVGTWATEMEIQAAADLVGLHIYTHCQTRWLKYSACRPFTGRCNETTGIYLKHCNNSHYEVVTCVRTSETVCTELCLWNYGSTSFAASNRRICDRKKREYDTNEEYRQAKVQKCTQRYHDDEHFRNCMKKRGVDTYNTNEQYKRKKIMQSLHKYLDNVDHREHIKKLSIEKYKTDEKHRENVKLYSVEKYKTDQEHRDNVKSLSVEKYKTDQEHRDNVKSLSVEKYKTDQEHRDNVKSLSVEKYKTDQEHRDNVKSLSVEKYKTDQEHRDNVKSLSVEKYKTDQEHRDNVKSLSVEKYKTDQEHRDNVKSLSVEKYKTDQEHRDNVKSLSVEKYKTDQEHRDNVKSLSVEKYKTDQEHRDNVKSLSVEKYKTDQEHRDNVKSLSVKKYKTDQEHRDNVKSLSVKKYKTDQEHRDNVKRLSVQKYSTDEKHKEHVKQMSVDRYKTDLHHVNRLKLQNTERRNTQKDNRKDMSYVLEQFRDKIATGPVHVCAVCHRALFKHQVVKCRKPEYLKKAATVALLAEKCITENYLHKCNVSCTAHCPDKAGPAGCLWICYTCHRKICNGKMPEESIANNLSLEPIPPELQMLNSLEQHLIAMHIPFMRIVSLPKGGQNGVHGPVTCVPSNMTNVVDVLPRSENIDQMIRVKLKRKLTYKGHYKYEFVCPDKIQSSLMYLQKHNKFYSNIQFNNDWINPLSKTAEAEDNDAYDQCVTEEKHDDGDSENDNIDETLHDRQQHGMFMDTCLQPVDVAQEILDQHFDGIMSVAPAEGNNPVRLLTDQSNEAKCFPVLFPKGTGTFHDNRPERLTLSRYLNTRILNADGRFAKNLDYIFYGQYLSEVNQVVSNVSIALRKGHCAHKTDITSEMLVNKDSLQRILNHDEGYKFLKPIRGTPVFWQSVQKDLFAMVRQLGIPTWFCSFSSADLRWPELMETILTQEGKHVSPDDLDWSERCDLLKRNPVTAARMFDHRFRCFLKDVIMSEAQPIGKIADYFYRIEFQQRGSPHSHCLFWVKDAPQIDKDDDDKVVAFIDHYVTCEMPSADDTEMNEIVSSVQQHSKKHSKTCKKKGTTCRFNFPRPPSSRTFLTRGKTDNEKNVDDDKCGEQSISANNNQSRPNMEHDLADSILKNVRTTLLNTEVNFESADDLFASLGINQETFEAAYQTISKKNSVVLKRKPCDAWVNQYNRHLLNAWNANMDIQFVIDAYSCIVYIISYISKAEREMGLLLSHAQKEAAQQGNLDAKQALRKLGSVFLHNREVSAQESVYRLSNMKLKEASRKVQFVPTCDAIRMSLPLNVIQRKAECLDEDSENIWMNSITDRYKGRPKTKDFEEMCLATFASEYRVLSKSEMSSPNIVKLDRSLGFVKKRSRTEPAVIRYARFSPTKNPAKYYESILELFLPHYSISQLKPPTFQTHQEFYEGGFVKYSDNELVSVKLIVDTNMSKFEKEADSIDQAQEDLEVHGPMEDAWAQICPETEQERLECLENKYNDNTNMNENSDVIPDLLPKQIFSLDNNTHTIPKDTAMALLRSLNAKQSQIFYQIRHWCLQKVRGEHPDPFHVFISGPGGVGKSVLIKAIHYEACRILSRLSQNPDETRVLLTAPTGVSAYNIDAATIHTSLSIGTDTKLPYQPLGDEKINALRTKLGNLDILIIDEISMVDHKLLAYIHGRLRQIKQCGDYSAFGKVSIIAVGDFYQLSPVMGKPLYSEPVGVNLWQNHFALVELTDIMRQKDEAFAQLLNRLRKRQKCDPLLTTDITMLKQCETGEGECTTNLHIYATNEEVDDHNRRMLHLICSETTVIQAQDYDRIPKTGRFQRVKGHHGNMCNTCLSRSLHIGINARVMLLKNIDVSDGLVNGAFGTVNAIHFNAGEDFPPKIYVTFDNEITGTAVRAKSQCLQPDLQKATPIEPDEERVTKSGGIRRQFPLKLAWACTIHKVQGLTVDKAVVSLKKIFAPGQAYVALSRVTSLQGLIIQDFKESVIYAKSDIESFMQTMPAFIQPVQETQLSPSLCKILLHNVQGLSCHLQDLQQDKRYMDADIICMTETWVQSRHNSDVQISGFSFYNQPRCLAYDTTDAVFAKLKDKQHGGVGMYYKPQTNCTIVDLPCMNLECMQFILPHLNATAAIVYRPSSYALTVFLNKLSSLIRHMDSFPEGKIIMGDFNVNLFVTNSVCEVMQHYGFTQVVKDATTENGTLIDHVYVKDLDIDKICISVMPTYFSCHECVVLYW